MGVASCNASSSPLISESIWEVWHVISPCARFIKPIDSEGGNL